MAAGGKRRHRLIQEKLDEVGLNASVLSRQMKLSYSVVLETMKGTRNNRKVLWKLLELGVDATALDLPVDITLKVSGESWRR